MNDSQEQCKHISITCEPVFNQGTILAMIEPYANGDYQQICLDLQWVEFMHSPFLGELIRAYTRLQRKNIELQLSHLAPINRAIIKQTNLDRIITLID